MNCVNCGAELGPVVRRDVPYRSLPGVTLVGVEAQVCRVCGNVEYEVPRVEALHATIARELVQKPTRLAGPEVRFLRKVLGWSGRDFAARVGVTPETVSRWENGSLVIGETPDKLLRMFVVHEQPVEHYELETFDTVAKDEGEPLHLRLIAAEGWRPLAA